MSRTVTGRFNRAVLGMAGVLLLFGCREEKRTDGDLIPLQASTRLSQRAYVWQRDWRAPVAQALKESSDLLDGVVVLGTEVEWKNGKPVPMRPNLDWGALRDFGRPVSLALRIAPYPGPFAREGEVVELLKGEVRRLLENAHRAGVGIEELQLDFDCAQKKLGGYALWVGELRQAAHPVPLVITALPSWLAEPTFPPLVREARRYVLQVHSVASPQGEEKTQICDPAQARRWVAQAEKVGLPYDIALPTYRSHVGYSPAGKLLGVVSDAVRPDWPADTRVREYALDAGAMAALVRAWLEHRPTHASGLLWYRLPVATDENNWRWPTLRAVIAGRAPQAAWQVKVNGANASGQEPLQEPADLVLCNTGETDEPPGCRVELRWEAEAKPTAEALPGWEVKVSAAGKSAIFFRAEKNARRLPPGAECAIGWLRLEPGAPFHVEVVPVR